MVRGHNSAELAWVSAGLGKLRIENEYLKIEKALPFLNF
jgi:hypothetical protein